MATDVMSTPGATTNYSGPTLEQQTIFNEPKQLNRRKSMQSKRKEPEGAEEGRKTLRKQLKENVFHARYQRKKKNN